MARTQFFARSSRKRVVALFALMLPSAVTALAAGCSETQEKRKKANVYIDGGRPEVMVRSASPDGGDAEPTAEGEEDDPVVARGRYLVDHVAACGECHTPGGDSRRYLAGVECLLKADNPLGPACLNSGNLTPSGIGRRTDAEVKAMITKGKRPEGRPLHPLMPYWVFHNMTDDDVDAIVKYLRTIPPVTHIVPPNAIQFSVREPAAAIDPGTIPRAVGGTDGGAERGRYLATMAGRCLECHTQDLPPGSIRPIDMSKAFGGNRTYDSKALGLQVPPVPEKVYSANITPAQVSGIGGWTAEDIKRAIKEGRDRNNAIMCPPMPFGPMGGYGGMTDEDALDIATYLMGVPKIDKFTAGSCLIQ